MPLIHAGWRPNYFNSEEETVVTDVIHAVALEVFNCDGGLRPENVVVEKANIIFLDCHNFSVHLQVSLKDAFFGHLSETELVQLRDTFKRFLKEQLDTRYIAIELDAIKAMLEPIPRY